MQGKPWGYSRPLDTSDAELDKNQSIEGFIDVVSHTENVRLDVEDA
jgi:hypothetical protein